MSEKPPTQAELVWKHDLILEGNAGGASMTLDSASEAGPSPMEVLALALSGCMAMDVVAILQKGRHDLRGLRATFSGRRAHEPPRRFLAIDLRFTVTGNLPRDPVERAVQLSRDKYCSVWQSMRQDIEFRVSVDMNNED
jgi:putative redox protein